MLKISNINAIGISIPLSTPMYMSGRAITHTENLIVRIEADGLIGWGEAASAPRMTGDILPGMIAVVNQIFKPKILGRSVLDYNKIIQDLDILVHNNTGPKCAIAMALLDLLSKFNEVPMYTLLGKKLRDNFNSIAILGNATIEEDIDEAKKLISTGTEFFKIKVGKSDIDLEINNTFKIRETIGTAAKLCADANAGLTYEKTIQYCKGVEEANLIFLEQPLQTMSQMADVLKHISIPLCMDESIFTVDDIIKMKQMNAGFGVNLKNIKIGGPSALIEAANVSNNLGISINISSKVAETAIATTVMLHCAAVSPNLDWGVSTTNQYLVQDIASFNAPLGEVIVDEYLLKQFTISDE
jgi:muconate cycloisomerase